MQFFKMPDGCSSCSFIRDCKGGCYMRRAFVDHGKDYWCERKGVVKWEPEDVSLLHEMLGKMDPQKSEVLTLHYLEEMKYEDKLTDFKDET